MVTLPPWFYTTSSDNRLCHTIEFLYNTEDEECRHKADAHQSAPYHIEVLAPEDGGDTHKEVTQGCSHKPSSHHHTLELGRSHLGDKRNTNG